MEPLRALRVEHPQAVAVFFDAVHRQRLALLIRQPLSAAEVATAMGEDLRRSHHHLQRYVALGLLAQVGERARRGRPQRLYRSVAERFFVARQDFPSDHFESTKELLLPVVSAMLDDAMRAADRTFERPRGRLFLLTETGDTLYPVGAYDENDSIDALIERYRASETLALWLGLHHVRLTFDEAKQLQDAMIALSNKIEEERSPHHDPSSRRYRALLMMTPVEGEPEP